MFPLIKYTWKKKQIPLFKEHYFLDALYWVVQELAIILVWNCSAFIIDIPEQPWCILSPTQNPWLEHFQISLLY